MESGDATQCLHVHIKKLENRCVERLSHGSPYTTGLTSECPVKPPIFCASVMPTDDDPLKYKIRAEKSVGSLQGESGS